MEKLWEHWHCMWRKSKYYVEKTQKLDGKKSIIAKPSNIMCVFK